MWSVCFRATVGGTVQKTGNGGGRTGYVFTEGTEGTDHLGANFLGSWAVVPLVSVVFIMRVA